MKLSSVQQKLILHWGEMGLRWGINRTVAQIHALLFLWPQPLDAETIAITLGVARSNVSTSLKELQGWRIVRRVHVLGDKRDHFECMKNVWEMFRVVLEVRKRREIDPTIAFLEECLAEAGQAPERDEVTEQRLRDLHYFFQSTTTWYNQTSKLPIAALMKFLATGDKWAKNLGLGGEPPATGKGHAR